VPSWLGRERGADGSIHLRASGRDREDHSYRVRLGLRGEEEDESLGSGAATREVACGDTTLAGEVKRDEYGTMTAARFVITVRSDMDFLFLASLAATQVRPGTVQERAVRRGNSLPCLRSSNCSAWQCSIALEYELLHTSTIVLNSRRQSDDPGQGSVV
jgi:hypothetical protein